MRVAHFAFARESRLLTPEQFQTVFNKPVRAASPQLTLLARPNTSGCPRIGFTISKKNVKLAVQRNRLKRICREHFRCHQHKLPKVDIVVLAKKGADQMSNDEIKELFKGLCRTLRRRLATS